ncbi:hypothetical protein CPT_Sycamore_052 [Streptomyces phage Sycamore]|uniref:Uncharacterized protein n=1 Tax=Streptomyces phage Sycamore TaxID=2767589 RepID=A0A873WKR9_9CAUD|nr:hypothetical protein CPT_Sycamore_052 [Streptomyces phage Sycamore]
MEIRLTAENINTVALAGLTIEGAEDLGPLRSVRLTRDGFDNAMVYGERGRDVLGLPSTVTVYKAA